MIPPAHLPPLPPGSRYAGRLRDFKGEVLGWVCIETPGALRGWVRGSWRGGSGSGGDQRSGHPVGMAGIYDVTDYKESSAEWHVALPVEVEQGSPIPSTQAQGVSESGCPSTHQVDGPTCPKCDSFGCVYPKDMQWICRRAQWVCTAVDTPSVSESECHSTHPVESDTPETDLAGWNEWPGAALEFARSLEQRLTDTRKLLATCSAEREHNVMMAGVYKAERDLLFKRLRDLYDYTESCEHGEPGWPREAPALARDILKTSLTP